MKMPEEMQLLLEAKIDDNFLKDNYSKLKEKYPDKFIAVKNGKVIAEGSNMDTIKAELKEIGEDPAFITIEFIHRKGTVIIL